MQMCFLTRIHIGNLLCMTKISVKNSIRQLCISVHEKKAEQTYEESFFNILMLFHNIRAEQIQCIVIVYIKQGTSANVLSPPLLSI